MISRSADDQLALPTRATASTCTGWRKEQGDRSAMLRGISRVRGEHLRARPRREIADHLNTIGPPDLYSKASSSDVNDDTGLRNGDAEGRTQQRPPVARSCTRAFP